MIRRTVSTLNEFEAADPSDDVAFQFVVDFARYEGVEDSIRSVSEALKRAGLSVFVHHSSASWKKSAGYVLVGVPAADSDHSDLIGSLSPDAKYDLSGFTGSAHLQRLVRLVMESIPASDPAKAPSLLAQLSLERRIADIFPLHEKEQRRVLRARWVTGASILTRQPLQDILAYLGPQLALYFAWLGHYSASLVPAALMGGGFFMIDLIEGFLYPLASSTRFAAAAGVGTGAAGGASADASSHSKPHAAAVPDVELWAMLPHALCISLWSALYLLNWKRRNATLTTQWRIWNYTLHQDLMVIAQDALYGGSAAGGLGAGASSPYSHSAARPVSAGAAAASPSPPPPPLVLRRSALTGSLLYKANTPRWQRHMRRLVSLGVSLCMCGVAVAAVLATNEFADWVRAAEVRASCVAPWQHMHSPAGQAAERVATGLGDAELLQEASNSPECLAMRFLPGSLQAFAIFVLGSLYTKVATELTQWENHQRPSQMQNNLIVKLCLFQFLNHFLGLFHLAFWKQDLLQLRNRLASLLVSRQIIGNLKELGVPWFKAMWKSRTLKRANADLKQHLPLLEMVEQATKVKYSSKDLFNDYLEMVVQFGYVSMFSAVWPLAAVFALANNIIEIRSDAFKFVGGAFQRPMVNMAVSIGSWEAVLDLMGVAAIAVNALLLWVFCRNQLATLLPFCDGDPALLLLSVMALEHALLLLTRAVGWFVGEVPEPALRERALLRLSQMEHRGRSTTTNGPAATPASDVAAAVAERRHAGEHAPESKKAV